MDMTQFDNHKLELECIEAFKQGDNDEASRLFSCLQEPAAIETSYILLQLDFACTNVSLLHLAALHGWMYIVVSLVWEYDCSSQCCDNWGQTPLHYAALGGSLPVVQYLITELHCDPLQCNNYDGSNSFLYACLAGHLYMVKYFITELGLDLTLPNKSGNLPLHLACFGGQFKVVRYLIEEQKCDPNSRGGSECTLLHCACQNGNMSLVQFLITEVKCDLALPNSDGNLPLHIACLNGHVDVVKYLITEQKCDPNSRGQEGYTPLLCALSSSNLPLLKYLIEDIGCDLTLPEMLTRIDSPLIKRRVNILPMVLDMSHMIDSDVQINRDLISSLHHESSILTADYSQNRGSLLCLACLSGNRDVMQYLIKELGCDPELSDYFGINPIHIASASGHLDTVKYLITEANCDPNRRGLGGATPLHYACGFGNINNMAYLITEVGCDPAIQDSFGNKPIHYACASGHLSIVKCLITKHNCNPNSRGFQGITPLHFACKFDRVDFIKYHFTRMDCDPMSRDDVGNVPMHTACSDQLSVVRYLCDKHGCSPDIQEDNGITPLHIACNGNHYDIVSYFVTELNCNPDIKDKFHQTPLHLVCFLGHVQILRYLLQYANVDALTSVNKFGHTPVVYAEFSDNSYDLLKVLQPLLQSKDDYPIHTYTKAVLTGNSAAGKTSLAQIIVKHANTPQNLFNNEIEVLKKVETLTAGIQSYVIKSENVGNLVLYDLAGQSEYYFSQSVMMETVMQRTPAIFINLVDLTKNEDEIAQAVHYWLTFIENATFKTLGTSCIIMVGSHIDQLSEEQIESKTTLVEDLVERRVKKLNYQGFVGMDCRKINTDGTATFFPLFSKCRGSIFSCAPPVSVYCHMLYAFLQTKLVKIACQLQDVVSSLTADEESPIPLEVPLLSKLLEDLSDKGLIIYLKNKHCVEKSWVVVKREAILKDVNGVLFAPKYFRGHHSIASSTGIIRMSSLHEPFPQYDAEMLVELMTCLEFCKPVNLSGINTNLRPLTSASIDDEADCLLFFPSLLRAERPQPPTSRDEQPCSQQLSFGWCLGCKDYEYQFLTTRFLHVLLLRLAYTFSKSRKSHSKTHSLSGIEQRCTVWTNGISWNNDDGIMTVVEVIQQNRWVVVTMFPDKETRPVEYSRHRSAVIRLVLDLQQELATDLDTFECLISISLLKQWSLKSLPETDLFSIEDVATSVLLRKPVILSQDDSHKLPTRDAVYFEPYHLLSPSSVCELMDSSKNDQPVSPALLNEVRECCQQPKLQPQSHFSLRENLDKMSIYAGRHPLVVAELDPDTVISTSLSAVTTTAQQPVEQLSSACGPSPHVLPSLKTPAVTTVDLSGIPDGTLDIDSHLPVLMVALADIAYQWEHLGTQLGLKYGKLQEIERNRRGIQMDCMKEMLAEWLHGSGGEYSKQALKTALQKINCSF